jgi:hypothetical protein
MNNIRPIIGLFLLFFCLHCGAALVINVVEPKTTAAKILITIKMKNTFLQNIESVRAVVFILDEHQKIISEMTRWIIGGTSGRPPLEPGKSATYNFVLSRVKAFASTKLLVNRVVLESGTLANVPEDVTVGTEEIK